MRTAALTAAGLALAAALWWPPEVYGGRQYLISAVLFLAMFLAMTGRSIPAGSAVLPAAALPASVFFLCLIASAVAGVDRYRSAETLISLSAGIALALGLRHSLTARAARTIESAFLCVMGAICAYGLYQYAYLMRTLAFDPGQWSGLASEEVRPALSRLTSGRIFSRFALPSTFSCAILAAVPVVHRRILRDPACLPEAILLAAMTACIVLARSYAAVLLFILYWCADAWVRYPRRRSALCAAGLVLIGVTSAFLRPAALFDLSASANPVRLRLDNWATAVSIFESAPWLGVGPGNFGLLFGAHSSGLTQTQYAHGLPMTVLAEAGVIGAIALAWLIIASVKSVAAASAPYRAGLLMMFIYSAVDIVFEIPSMTILFFFLLGLGSAAPAAGVFASPARAGSPPFVSAARVMFAGFAACGAALCLVIFAARYQHAEGSIRLNMPGTPSPGLLSAARERLELSARLWPAASTEVSIGMAHLLQAGHAKDSQNLVKARTSFLRAVDKSPASANYRVALARTMLALGDTPGAAMHYREAAKLDPRGPHMDRYVALILDGTIASRSHVRTPF